MTRIAATIQAHGTRDRLQVELAGNDEPVISIYGPKPSGATDLVAYFGLAVMSDVKRRELAKAILGDLPLEAPPTLPTARGLYRDVDEEHWLISSDGERPVYVEHGRSTIDDPENYLPFTLVHDLSKDNA